MVLGEVLEGGGGGSLNARGGEDERNKESLTKARTATKMKVKHRRQ